MNYLKYLLEKINQVFTPRINYRPTTLHRELNDYQYAVDDLTYSDLLLDEYSAKHNGTSTSFGDQMFDHWLRSIKPAGEVEALQGDMKTLRHSGNLKRIAALLKKAGKQNRGDFMTDLWHGFQIRSFVVDNIVFIFILNLLLLLSLTAFLSHLFPLWIMLFFINNLAIYVSSNYYIASVSGSINYIIKGLIFLKKMDKRKLHCISRPMPDYRVFKNILWSGYLFKEGIGGPHSNDIVTVLFDYFRVFFCLEVFSFKITSGYILRHIGELRHVIAFLGYYDCLVNNVELMEKGSLCYSDLNNGSAVDFVNMKHPLIESAVGQSRSVPKGMIITGLNMAGKSTFMRSLGLNQLLATSFGIACADSFSTGIRHIATSFRIHDQLLENKSRYFAEAERIVHINQLIQNSKSLCLIDEILSGTNSEDRIQGSIQILGNMAECGDSMVVSATHDRKIASSLAGKYDTCFFDGQYENGEIRFDFKLKEGIVSEKNGLLILRTLGIEI